MNISEITRYGTRLAAIDAATGESVTYSDLKLRADLVAEAANAGGSKRLALILASNTIDCLAAYIAALQLGDAIMLFDAKLSCDLVAEIVARYQPDWIFAAQDRALPPEYAVVRKDGASIVAVINRRCDEPLHPELAVLLSTSGSTGSPKLVRLSRRNIEANAASIAEYLRLTRDSRPITSLPMSYSYGLSVINSHLLVGGTLVLTNQSIMQRPFWQAFDDHRATSFAGVPYMYQVLLQFGMFKKPRPSLNTLTQAGGRLDPQMAEQVRDIAETNGWKFFVMYGQTEATARISYVPPDRLHEKRGCIGIPIPGGEMRIDPSTQELIYRGPNVMMGYAEDRAALSKGDELRGELRTGDLARQDEDGFFYITGRLKRFIKIYGNRINLDEVEAILRRQFNVPLACYGRDDQLCIALTNNGVPGSDVIEFLFSTFQLNSTAVRTFVLEQLPYTSNGKIDYPALAAAAS